MRASAKLSRVSEDGSFRQAVTGKFDMLQSIVQCIARSRRLVSRVYQRKKSKVGLAGYDGILEISGVELFFAGGQRDVCGVELRLR